MPDINWISKNYGFKKNSLKKTTVESLLKTFPLCIIFIPAIAILCLLQSCASNYAPSDWLQEPHVAAKTGYGGWAEIRFKKNDSLVTGELIAVYPDTLFILSNLKRNPTDTLRPRGRIKAIAKNNIGEIQITFFDANEGAIAGAGLLGTLSTVSHGFWLVFSAPIWVISTGATAAVRSYEPVIEYPDANWETLAIYSRFPQGIPEMIERDSILTKPYPED